MQISRVRAKRVTKNPNRVKVLIGRPRFNQHQFKTYGTVQICLVKRQGYRVTVTH